MESTLRSVIPGIKIGKILIQRDPETHLPKVNINSLHSLIWDLYLLKAFLYQTPIGYFWEICPFAWSITCNWRYCLPFFFDSSLNQILILVLGSSAQAIRGLIDHNVKEENIIFVNIISCPEGLEKIASEFPKVRIVTSAVDPKMNENKYILPGCGDYGDRYFGTDY